MVVGNIFFRDCLHVLDRPQDRQTHDMVFKDALMRDLDGSFHGHGLSGLQQFSVDCTSLILYIFPSVKGVCDHIADDLYSFVQVVFENCHHVRSILAGGVGIEAAPDVLHSDFQFFSGPVDCALEVQVLQKVSGSAGLIRLIPTTAFDEDRNAGYIGRHDL